ncbi:MAG: AI-2E family transporter, partial [Dolichospermum sp.]
LIQFINYFQPLVSIISIAILLAFVLDYPIKLLQKRGVPRILAVVLVLLLSIIMLGAIGVILLPLILEQLNELANLLPYWIESGTQQIETLENWASTQKLPLNLGGLAT